MTHMLQAAGLSWSADGDCTVAATVDGNTYLVHVPASSVRFELRKACRLEGFDFANEVGDVDVLGWFGGKILKKAKKAAKSVVKKAKKVARRTVSSVKQIAKTATVVHRMAANQALKYGQRYGAKALNAGGQVLTSKYLAGAVAASALVCPAIGGPALAAYAAARAAYGTYKAGGAAAQTVATNVRRLASGKSPTVNQQLLLSALRSQYQ